MSLEICTQNHKLQIDPMPVGISHHTIELTVPDKICIRVWGKGINDTRLDAHGAIVQDKYILLRDMRVDRMSVDPHWLPRYLTLHTESGKTVESNYWGFNGQLEIEVGPTVFQFVAGTYTK